MDSSTLLADVVGKDLPDFLIKKTIVRRKPLVQSNVVTSAKTDLTRDQRRIVYYFLRAMYLNKGWPVNGTIDIDHRAYARLYGIGEQEARDDLRRAIAEFRGKVISWSQKDGWNGELENVEVDWTTRRVARPQSGKYTITINHELKPLLTPLEFFDPDYEGKLLPFTVMDEDEVKLLKTKYGGRFYEALCQFRSTGFFSVELESLRERWGTPTSYKKYSLFKAKILNPCIDEVRELPAFRDLTMTENLHKTTGAVIGLMFNFTPF